jgi:hypothetical protein
MLLQTKDTRANALVSRRQRGAAYVELGLNINKIDKLERIVSRGNVLSQTKLTNLLKGRVTCGHCGSNMHSNSGTGKTKKKTYVYCRCDNKDCDFKLNNPNNPKHYKHQVRRTWLPMPP